MKLCSASIVILGMVLAETAIAAEAGDQPSTNKTEVKGVHKKAAIRHHKKSKKAHEAAAHAAAAPAPAPAPAPGGGLSPEDQARLAAMAASPARFDKNLGYKGWNFHFPSFGDSLLQDYGGWRSTLAQYGIGLLEYNAQIGSVNMLNTPTAGLGPSNATSSNPLAGNSRQQYFGQRPGFLDVSLAFLTIDTSQWGVPDGQIGISGNWSYSGDQHQVQNKLSNNGVSWYQTFFNKALEVKAGIFPNGDEWVGVAVGGNFASPFGSQSVIPYEMGMSQTPAVQPAIWGKWHITDTVYNQFGVMRSLAENGPSGDLFFDDAHLNPTGYRFAVPNGRVLLVDELGYKNEAAPNVPQTWLRYGAMYNTSKFPNYQAFLANPTVAGTPAGEQTGSSAMYFLADRQLYQLAPNSPFTAYRGIYAGVSAMYAAPENLAVSQYYEARVYSIGLFELTPGRLVESCLWPQYHEPLSCQLL